MFSGEQTPEDVVPPSVLAAQKDGGHWREHEHVRGYSLLASSHDPTALAAELAATQALLRARSAAEVGAILATLVRDLGGVLIPARYADPATTLPIDVSLGLGEPLLPFADPVSIETMRMKAALPEFVEAARMVLAQLQGDVRRDDEVTRDQLTGVLTRRAWMRRLSAATPGDSLCLVDLDDFKTVNDGAGHAAGDAVLRAVGSLMLLTFREDDFCGRYGGDEFVCLTPGLSGPGLEVRCEELREAWQRDRPLAGARVGLSIGVAEVGEGGGDAALRSADSAMYRGKTAGGDRTVIASMDDGAPDGPE